MRTLKIHGDNVVECERAMSLVSDSLGISFEVDTSSAIVSPHFLSSDGSFRVELLPGHGRWGLDVAGLLRDSGSTVRENADAVISEVVSNGEEKILVAIEFCGALPAGNNAWQRHGRALGFGQAKVPYLIYNEIGGYELGPDRKPKASRLPNPAVPYSLIQYSDDCDSIVLPVYELAPSAPNESRATFSECLGGLEAQSLLDEIINGSVDKETVRQLRDRSLALVDELTNARRRKDTLSSQQWRQVLDSTTDRVASFLEFGVPWTRSTSQKVEMTNSAREFMIRLETLAPTALGSASLPFFAVPTESLDLLAQVVTDVYRNVGRELARWIHEVNEPIVIVLVTGFKPRGDDSRPDRGLAPLARMLAGPSARLLSFLWGPGNAGLLSAFRESPTVASDANGLIEALASCSDRVLVDSVNAKAFHVDTSTFGRAKKSDAVRLKGKFQIPEAGEHDVDSAFHFLVSSPQRDWVFEGMCNPPGGDWSGISISVDTQNEIRWTSLPRVSPTGKRPDHVVQVLEGGIDYIFSVESKQTSLKMETNVGPMLTRYTNDLFSFPPTIRRVRKSGNWEEFKGEILDWQYKNFSLGLFVFRSIGELAEVLERSCLDIVGAFEFGKSGQTTFHLTSRHDAQMAQKVLLKAIGSSSFNVKICEY